MDDHESQNHDGLIETMKAAHLQIPQSDSEKSGLPDIKCSSDTDETPSLTNLAGELEDLIITNLHPSAAIALSQTNHHFHSCVNLHRLPFSGVFNWFREMEQLPTNSENYGCYTCFRIKPRSAFANRQTKTPRGKVGCNACMRICLDCGFSTRTHVPGSMMKIRGELQVFCMGCETFRKRFCSLCRWCDSCISKGSATVLMKGEWAKRNGEASKVTIRNLCRDHTWKEPKPVLDRVPHPIFPWLNMDEMEDELWSDY